MNRGDVGSVDWHLGVGSFISGAQAPNLRQVARTYAEIQCDMLAFGSWYNSSEFV